MSYMVATTDGVRVNDGNGKGMDEATVASSVKDRNERAVALGIEARYEAVEFVALEKE